MAAVEKRQKPADWPPTAPRGPAWCPGGRTAQKAFLARRGDAHTSRTASTAAPAARRAAVRECSVTSVSASMRPIAGVPGATAARAAKPAQRTCSAS
eukprot:scaffold9_cov97-Isochrysis_galbana.AAC.5